MHWLGYSLNHMLENTLAHQLCFIECLFFILWLLWPENTAVVHQRKLRSTCLDLKQKQCHGCTQQFFLLKYLMLHDNWIMLSQKLAIQIGLKLILFMTCTLFHLLNRFAGKGHRWRRRSPQLLCDAAIQISYHPGGSCQQDHVWTKYHMWRNNLQNLFYSVWMLQTTIPCDCSSWHSHCDYKSWSLWIESSIKSPWTLHQSECDLFRSSIRWRVWSRCYWKRWTTDSNSRTWRIVHLCRFSLSKLTVGQYK